MSKILVVPTAEVESIFRTEGFIPYDESGFLRLLEYGEFQERDEVETDFSYKQLIPYVIFSNGDKIFVYQRSSSSDESRLREKYSIGIGGHIDDADQGNNILDLVHNAMLREVEEEIGISTDINQYTLPGFINDNTNDVGKVHFGLVFQYPHIENIPFQGGETDILLKRKIVPVLEIQGIYDFLEGWSKIVFDEIRRSAKTT